MIVVLPDTGAQILTKLLTVDGSGSGLDADTLDSHDSAYFLAASSYTAADVLSKLLTVDGSGSGLDADTLDSHDTSYFLAASAVSAYGLTLIDDADAVNARATLGIGTLGSANGQMLVYSDASETFESPNNLTFIGDTLTVTGAPTSYDTPAFKVVRTNSDTAATGPTVTAVFRNTGDDAGSSDYQNEVHLVLQAGTSADHRRYINFRGADGIDDGKMGFNAKSVFILYDDNAVHHRLWFENTVSSPNNTGNSYIESAGTGAVIINGLDDTTGNGGTGGFQIWSGGASPSKVFDVNSSGQFATRGIAMNTRYSGTIGGTTTLLSGSSTGGLLIQPTHDSTAGNATNVFNGAVINPITTGTGTFQFMYGLQMTASHQASSTIANVIGGLFIAQNQVAQTVTAAYAAQFQIQNNNASGTITTANGVYVTALTNSGTITNFNAIRVIDTTAATFTAACRLGMNTGTGKWNIYVDGTANNVITGLLGLGSTTTPTAHLHINGNISASAWGLNGINQRNAAATFTDSSTASSGTATNAVANSFGQPTFAANNTSVTITNAATVYIANSPANGSNVTCTNKYSLWVDDGDVRFDGNIGFFATTPAARPTGYTQTYSTTTRTFSSYTANDQSAAYTGQDNAQAGSVYAKVNDLNTLRTAYENLRAFAENVGKLVNSLIDDGQTYGLLQ